MKKVLIIFGFLIFISSYSNAKTFEIDDGDDDFIYINVNNKCDLTYDTHLYWNTNFCDKVEFEYVSTERESTNYNLNLIKKRINVFAEKICPNSKVVFDKKKIKLPSFLYPTRWIEGDILCPNAREVIKEANLIREAEHKRKIEETRIAKQKEKDEAKRLEQEVQDQEEFDSRQKKIDTCKAYGFKAGTESFGNCIFKLMELELEYAKLENEKLKLEAQAEQAKLNNQAALANSLATQAQAANRDKALRIQQFGIAMQGIANSLQPSQEVIGPKITCHKNGNLMQCY